MYIIRLVKMACTTGIRKQIWLFSFCTIHKSPLTYHQVLLVAVPVSLINVIISVAILAKSKRSTWKGHDYGNSPRIRTSIFQFSLNRF